MFIGEHEHSIDGKSRLSIPADFRQAIDENEPHTKLVITRGLDTCLFVYTASQWDQVRAALKAMSFTDGNVRNFKRFFYGSAREVDIDAQGRILIPEVLREAAQLGKDVTILGTDERMEIWDRARWNALKQSSAGEFERLADKLAEKLG